MLHSFSILELIYWHPTCMHWNLFSTMSTRIMGPIPIKASQLKSITITSPFELNRYLWINVWCWWWRFWWQRFCWWSDLYLIVQMHKSSWYWNVNGSLRIIIRWDKLWRCISGTNMIWYLIHSFLMRPIFSYLLLTCQLLFLVMTFSFIYTNMIQNWGRIYQSTIL